MREGAGFPAEGELHSVSGYQGGGGSTTLEPPEEHAEGSGNDSGRSYPEVHNQPSQNFLYKEFQKQFPAMQVTSRRELKHAPNEDLANSLDGFGTYKDSVDRLFESEGGSLNDAKPLGPKRQYSFKRESSLTELLGSEGQHATEGVVDRRMDDDLHFQGVRRALLKAGVSPGSQAPQSERGHPGPQEPSDRYSMPESSTVRNTVGESRNWGQPGQVLQEVIDKQLLQTANLDSDALSDGFGGIVSPESPTRRKGGKGFGPVPFNNLTLDKV
jgi:hypothetical protein